MHSEPPQILPPAQKSTLESWKEIAAFLKVTVRTAQNWEAERGMPVKRGPGVKGRVYANTAELKAWREGSSTEAPAAPVIRPSRWPLVAAVAMLFFAATVSLWMWFRSGDPVTFTLDGPVLTVLDGRDREVWRYRFASEPQRPWTARGYPAPAFHDIDGDGRNELLFPFHYSASSERSDVLYCFGPRGDIRWTFTTSRAVLTGEKMYPPVFSFDFFVPVPAVGKKESRLLVGSRQEPEYPTRIALLSSAGNLLREYWHSGQIRNPLVADVDGDGKPEIYLTGVANSYKAAVLVALDPENFEGASLEADPKYQIMGMPPPRELARLLFPRSSLNLAIHPYNLGGTILHAGTSIITVTVLETPGKPSPAEVYYEFEPRLKLARVEVGDINYAIFKQLHAAGVLKSDLTQAEIDSYRDIRFLTPWRK